MRHYNFSVLGFFFNSNFAQGNAYHSYIYVAMLRSYYASLCFALFSSPWQRQCELLPSLGVRHALTFHILIFSYMWTFPAGAFFSRFWGSLPSTFKIFRPWKKNSTIKSWPTFCDQYFWKFPIWNSRAEEKRRKIWMVKVNVVFNDIRLLICLTPL